MKKILINFLTFLFLFSLISCKQLIIGIEETFSYWTDIANIIGIEIPSGVPVDEDGFFSLPSGEDAHIYFKLHNSQKFEFLMPNDTGAPADIIIFDKNVKGQHGGSPEAGIDYSLVQKAFDKLELTYTKEFLLKNEQGKANLNPKINLYNKRDKRRFEQNYNYKLRANTVPPKPEWLTTGKIQQGSDWYYVLIFKFESIPQSINLHGDISEVHLTVAGLQKAPIPIRLTNSGFDLSGSQEFLIPPNEVIMPIATTGFPHIPNENDRKWMLCIKTEVKIGESLSYEAKVKDWKGLVSEETSGITNLAKLPVPQISYDSGMSTLITSGVYTDNESALSTGTATNPIHISSCFGNTVVLKAHNTAYPSSGVTIDAEVKLSASTPAPSDFTGPKGSSQQSGGITKILLDPIPGVDEIYEVKLKARGPNYTDSDEKTYYYKIKKEVRSGNGSWQILKKAVNLVSAGDTVYINGHIVSTNEADNSGEIEVREDINIQGLNGKAGDIIDANKDGSNKPGTLHRIFTIKIGRTLNLTGLTLQNGKAGIGGAVISENGSVLTLSNTDIKDSEASTSGGAIYTGGTLNINDGSVISGNKAHQGGAVYNNGTFKISGSAKITIDPTTNDVYLPSGKVITVTGQLTEANVARITPEANTYTEGREVVKGDGFTLPNTYVSKFNLTPKAGENWLIQKHDTQNALVLKQQITEITSWQVLQDVVTAANSGDTIIIKGHIKAGDHTQQISIDKNLTITGSTGKAVDIIDADSKHRIFEVKENKSLTVRNITLQKGKVEGSPYEATGGAIKAGNGSVLTLDNTDIADSEAGMAGGAISSTGNIDIKGNSIIRNNKTISPNGLGGAVYNSGTFKISGSAKITVDLTKNDVYLTTGKIITVTGALTENSIARITPAENPYTESRQVVKGEGYILNDGDISKFSLTQKPGQTWSLQRDSSQNALVLKKEITKVTTWQGLQDAVTAANSGDTITVKNTLTANNSTSEISIRKNLTIEGEGPSAVLDANYKHRIFKVHNGATLKLKDITLKKGKDDIGGLGAGVHVTGASLELENVTITECKNNTNSGKGGAIYISSSSDGRLWIKGSSKIVSNEAEKGAGIYITTNSGENIIEGSTEISGNTCTSNGKGGGIYLDKGSLVLQNNAQILNNESRVGADGGGGVYISDHGTLTIKGSCIIQGNNAKKSDGTIVTGNGGGIYNSGTLIMEGGEIKENKAKLGGAVYNNGTFKISGSAKIVPSAVPDENTLGKNDIYLPADKVITVTGSLTETPVARISPVAPYNASRSVVEASSGVTLADQVSKFKVTDDTDGKKWRINAAGQLEEDNQGKTVTTWAELKTEVQKISGGAELIIVQGTLTAGGVSDEINVNRNVTIKGKDSSATLNANEKCRIFKVDDKAILKLDNIKLTKGKVTNQGGGAIKILEGECIITNTVISNCEAKDGGAIDIDLKSGGEKAHCTLKIGTKIEYCKTIFTGGGVRIYGDKSKTLLTMETGSSISSCTADTNGGAVWSKATFNMTGGSIEENMAGLSNLTSTMVGSGGGVFNGEGGIFNMSGGKIIKNKAIVDDSNSFDNSGNGGGVCIHKSNFTMTGGIIGGDENGEANIATKKGGGVFHLGNKFELSGNAKITPSSGTDEYTHGKNDVYLSNKKKIKIIGSLTAGQNQAARITVPDANYTEGKLVLEGDATVNLSNEAKKFKVTKKETQNWYVDNDGKLTITAPSP